jgi:hypothetical protein
MNNVLEYCFFVFYECGSWSLALKTGHKVVVPENKVLRKIFGTTKEELTGE